MNVLCLTFLCRAIEAQVAFLSATVALPVVCSSSFRELVAVGAKARLVDELALSSGMPLTWYFPEVLCRSGGVSAAAWRLVSAAVAGRLVPAMVGGILFSQEEGRIFYF
jgi:hypothetical protein